MPGVEKEEDEEDVAAASPWRRPGWHADDGPVTCAQCGATDPPRWRNIKGGPGQTLCNACHTRKKRAA